MSRQNVILGIVVAFLVGNVTGCFLGIFTTEFGKELLEGAFETEQAADVKRPRDLERPGFSLQYPRNWKVGVDEEDYDPDHMFTINSPGSCYALFLLYDFESDPEGNVKSQVEHFKKMVYGSKETRFEKWGRYTGKGSELRGRVVGFRGWIKVFSHSTDQRSFVVVALGYEEDRKKVGPGFALLERTFLLR